MKKYIKQSKRILSFILAFTLILSVMVIPALAADPVSGVDGVVVTISGKNVFFSSADLNEAFMWEEMNAPETHPLLDAYRSADKEEGDEYPAPVAYRLVSGYYAAPEALGTALAASRDAIEAGGELDTEAVLEIISTNIQEVEETAGSSAFDAGTDIFVADKSAATPESVVPVVPSETTNEDGTSTPVEPPTDEFALVSVVPVVSEDTITVTATFENVPESEEGIEVGFYLFNSDTEIEFSETATAVINEDGIAVAEFTGLVAGTYNVTVTVDNYDISDTEEGIIVEAAVPSEEFEIASVQTDVLLDTIKVTATFINVPESGEGIEVGFYLFNSDTEIEFSETATAVINEDGIAVAEFTGLVAGTYNVTVTVDNYDITATEEDIVVAELTDDDLDAMLLQLASDIKEIEAIESAEDVAVAEKLISDYDTVLATILENDSEYEYEDISVIITGIEEMIDEYLVSQIVIVSVETALTNRDIEVTAVFENANGFEASFYLFDADVYGDDEFDLEDAIDGEEYAAVETIEIADDGAIALFEAAAIGEYVIVVCAGSAVETAEVEVVGASTAEISEIVPVEGTTTYASKCKTVTVTTGDTAGLDITYADFTVTVKVGEAAAITYTGTDDFDGISDTETKKWFKVADGEDDDTFIVTFYASVANLATITVTGKGQLTGTQSETFKNAKQLLVEDIAECAQKTITLIGSVTGEAVKAAALKGITLTGTTQEATDNGDNTWTIVIKAAGTNEESQFVVTVVQPNGLGELSGELTLVEETPTEDGEALYDPETFTLTVFGEEEAFELDETNDAIIINLLENLGVGNTFEVDGGVVEGITINVSVDLSLAKLTELGLTNNVNIAINGGLTPISVTLPSDTTKFLLMFSTEGAVIGTGNTAGISAGAAVETNHLPITLSGTPKTGVARVGINGKQVYTVTTTAGDATVIDYVAAKGVLNYSAFIGEVGYNSLDLAIAAATTGSVIDFYGEIELANNINLPSGAKIVLQGMEAAIVETDKGELMSGTIESNVTAQETDDGYRLWCNDFALLGSLIELEGTITINKSIRIADGAGAGGATKHKITDADLVLAKNVTLTLGAAAGENGSKSLWLHKGTLTMNDDAKIVIEKAGGLRLTSTSGEDLITGKRNAITMKDDSVFKIGDTTTFTAETVDTNAITFENFKLQKDGEIRITSTNLTGQDKLTLTGAYAIGGKGVNEIVTIAPNVMVRVDGAESFVRVSGILNVEGTLSLYDEGSIQYGNTAISGYDEGECAINFIGTRATLAFDAVPRDRIPEGFVMIGTTTVLGSTIKGLQLDANAKVTLSNGNVSGGENLWASNSLISGNATIPADVDALPLSAFLGAYMPECVLTLAPNAKLTIDGKVGLGNEIVIPATAEVEIGETGQVIAFAGGLTKNAGTVTIKGAYVFASDADLPIRANNTGTFVLEGINAGLYKSNNATEAMFTAIGNASDPLDELTKLVDAIEGIIRLSDNARAEVKANATGGFDLAFTSGTVTIIGTSGISVIDEKDTLTINGATVSIMGSDALEIAGSLTITSGLIKGGKITLVEDAKVTGAAGKFKDGAVTITKATEITVGADGTPAGAEKLSAGEYVWNGTMFVKTTSA